MYQENILRNIILGPIGLVNLLVAKACGASCVAITGKTTIKASQFIDGGGVYGCVKCDVNPLSCIIYQLKHY